MLINTCSLLIYCLLLTPCNSVCQCPNNFFNLLFFLLSPVNKTPSRTTQNNIANSVSENLIRPQFIKSYCEDADNMMAGARQSSKTRVSNRVQDHQAHLEMSD